MIFKLKKEKWEVWLKNREKPDYAFKNYLARKIIRKGATIIEVKGHLHKAKRNLHFSRRIIDDLKGFYEWAIIVYYYAVYQAALALCASKGFKTKTHLATICILIKFFYPKQINEEDIKAVANNFMAEKEIREFVELKDYRENATYSISLVYEKRLAEKLSEKAIDFVNKAEKIIMATSLPQKET